MSIQGIDHTVRHHRGTEILFPDLLWAVAVGMGLLPVVGFYLLFLS
jgi:hypothetical protein